MPSQDDESTLADVQRQHPAWHCWRAVSGLYYARPAHAAPGDRAPVHGEDPLDLHHQIIRAEANEDQ
jgi:hypothetical protein